MDPLISAAREEPKGAARLMRLYVHNFRTFVNFEWEPPTTGVVVGDNGAGKTALLEVLWLLQDLLVAGKAIDETAAMEARTTWLSEPRQAIEVDFQIGSELYRYRLLVHHGLGRAVIEEELVGASGPIYRSRDGVVDLISDPGAGPDTRFRFDRRRSFVSAIEPGPESRRATAFRDAIASIWAMQPDPRRLGNPASAEDRRLERDLSNFANWYRSKVQEDPDASDALRTDLQRVLPGFSTLRLEPISSEAKELRARFSFGGKTHELGWAKLSDGQRLLIALYGMLRFGLPQASLVVLDECENYIAPREIQPWLQAVLDAAAERHQQIVIVSHHPESINYLAADTAWRMWRDKDAGHSRIARLSPDLDAGETAYDLVKIGQEDQTTAPNASDGG